MANFLLLKLLTTIDSYSCRKIPDTGVYISLHSSMVKYSSNQLQEQIFANPDRTKAVSCFVNLFFFFFPTLSKYNFYIIIFGEEGGETNAFSIRNPAMFKRLIVYRTH